MSDPTVRAVWAKRVLGYSGGSAASSRGTPENDIALATSAARGREAAASNPRSVAFTKLLLHWRDAQARLGDSLRALAAAILADDSVKADPRRAAVETAVKGLPQLVPTFGDALEAAMDKLIAGGDPKSVGKDVLAAIAAYRQRLAAAAELRQLETIAGQHLRATPLIGPLDEVLADIEHSVSAAI